MKRFLVLLLGVCMILVIVNESYAFTTPNRDVGMPYVQNFSAEQYNAHIQNWDFADDDFGHIFVANSSGPMVFDGKHWQQFMIPNASSFSIATDVQNRAFVGGISEFGYLYQLDVKAPRSTALLVYKSLRNLIPADLAFGNVWSTLVLNDHVYFMSGEYVFIYDGESVEYFRSQASFTRMIARGNSVLLFDRGLGIFELTTNGLIPWEIKSDIKPIIIRGYTTFDDSELFCDHIRCYRFEDGHFTPFVTEADSQLAASSIDNILQLKDGTLVINTRRGGLFHLDSNGRLIRTINTDSGLTNNTTYHIFQDKWGSVWVATVNGISRIDFGLPLRRFDHNSPIQEPVNRMLKVRNIMYFSTQAGVYSMNEWGIKQKVHTSQNCRNLIEHQDKLIALCQNVLYQIDQTEITTVASELPIDAISRYGISDWFVIHQNNEIGLARIEANEIIEYKPITEISMRPNEMVTDERGNIWIGTEQAGVYHLTLEWNDAEVQLKNKQSYLTETSNYRDIRRVNPAKLSKGVVFLNWGYGLMRFNYDTGAMEPETRYGSYFNEPDQQIFWVDEDPRGNVWFRISSKYVGALKVTDDSYETISGVLNMIDRRQSNYIYADSSDFVWFSTENGIIRLDTRKPFNHQQEFTTQIYRIFKKGALLFQDSTATKEPIFDYSRDLFRFTYASNTFIGDEYNQYRIKLDGFDDDWSDWSSETQRDYTNITEGTYQFRVQSKNVFEEVSEAESFIFTVLPPWHRTIWAYIMYLLGIGGIFYVGFKIRLNKLTRVYRIRNRIASDLHDEISATLSSISFFASALDNPKADEQRERFVRLIAESAGDAKEKISDIVWAINPEHDDWRSFLSKCRRFASDLLESKKINHNLRIDENYTGNLDMQFRQHLWMIFKEMITNIARHADATRVDVIMKFEPGMLNVVVQDDGKGISADNPKAGNGLTNIKKRAALIRGEIHLDSHEGMGTRWNLKIRL